jgi:hypothetical protein
VLADSCADDISLLDCNVLESRDDVYLSEKDFSPLLLGLLLGIEFFFLGYC